MNENDSRKFSLADAVRIPAVGEEATITLEQHGSGDDAEYMVRAEMSLTDKMSVVRTFRLSDTRGVYVTKKKAWALQEDLVKDGAEFIGAVHVREEAPTLLEFKMAMKAGESLEYYSEAFDAPGDPNLPDPCPNPVTPPVRPPGDIHNPDPCPESPNPPPMPPTGG